MAAFPGGASGRAVLADDGHARPHLARALEAGLGGGEREREWGGAHDRRRLAWLAGACWLAETRAPLVCGVLGLDMTLPPDAEAGEE